MVEAAVRTWWRWQQVNTKVDYLIAMDISHRFYRSCRGHLVRDAEAVAEVQAQHELLEEPAGVGLRQPHLPVQRLIALQVHLQ